MISEGLQKLIGKKSVPRVFVVNKTDIRKIADATGDRNPLYWDDEYAANSRYGSIIAPPDFFGWPVNWTSDLSFVGANELVEEMYVEIFKAGYTRAINAGMESEFFRPIRAGETVILSCEIASIEEKEGKKGGKMLFETLETTVINQNGDLVAKQRFTSIH